MEPAKCNGGRANNRSSLMEMPPFCLAALHRYLAPYACHRPHMPAARHIGAFKGLKVPRVPSWNESEALLKQKVGHSARLPLYSAGHLVWKQQ